MPSSYTISKTQARKFLFLYHGLLGGYRFEGEQGVLQLITHLTAIQFDPIDVCGRNADIVLHSRVDGYKKEYLNTLLYERRELIDYFDKCMCIVRRDDWSRLKGQMMYYYNTPLGEEKIRPILSKVLETIAQRGAICSADLEFNESVEWYWGDAKLSRAALDYLYYRGDIIIHHRVGVTKYYDLASRYISTEMGGSHSDYERMKWYVFRLICAVGLMCNKASDVWINIEGLKAKERGEIITNLITNGQIIEIDVVDFPHKLYAPSTAILYLESILLGESYQPRCEFIAPLDSLIWDRKLIKDLFDFDYKWEIYTPKHKRKYGHYVLPIIYDSEFIGRIEMVRCKDDNTLQVANIWYEDKVNIMAAMFDAINDAISRYAMFN